MSTSTNQSTPERQTSAWVEPQLKPYHKTIARLLPLALCTLVCYTLYTIYGYYYSAEIHRTNRLDREVRNLRQHTNYRMGRLETEERSSQIEKRVAELGLALEMPATPPIFIIDSTSTTN